MAEAASDDMALWRPTRLVDVLSALLGCLEGAKLQAYPDSGNVWTVGIGHTQGVTPGMVITPQQMADFLAADARPILAAITGRPILEAAALGSFGFNCGLGAMLRVMSGADSLDNPKHTTDRTGEVRSGLVMRRHLEQVLIALSKQTQPRPVT